MEGELTQSRVVVLGIDDSEWSERAFDCKHILIQSLFKSLSGKWRVTDFELFFPYNPP